MWGRGARGEILHGQVYSHGIFNLVESYSEVISGSNCIYYVKDSTRSIDLNGVFNIIIIFIRSKHMHANCSSNELNTAAM